MFSPKNGILFDQGHVRGGSLLGPVFAVPQGHSGEWPPSSFPVLRFRAVLFGDMNPQGDGTLTLRQNKKSPDCRFVREGESHSCE